MNIIDPGTRSVNLRLWKWYQFILNYLSLKSVWGLAVAILSTIAKQDSNTKIILLMNHKNIHPPSLENLRREIDNVDRELFSLLAQRMNIVKKIGAAKRAQGLPISDPVREALLKARLKEIGTGVMEPWHVEELTSVILRISRDLQEK